MTLPLSRAGMAAAVGNLSEEQVHCSICLDVFTDPASIPCGHNFCRGCILGYWRAGPPHLCPMCKKAFQRRPDVSVNTVLREIARQFKEMRLTRGGNDGDEGPTRQQQGAVESNGKDGGGKDGGRKNGGAVEPAAAEKLKRWAMDRRGKEEDEERLLGREQQEHPQEELRQKQEEQSVLRMNQAKGFPEESSPAAEKGERATPAFVGLHEELPPLVPPPRNPRTPLSPAVSALPPPPLPPPPPSPPPPPPSPQPISTWEAEEEEEVLCDVCLGEARPAAAKSCLVCLTSYCEEHLRAHAARFAMHALMEPVANMEERMCPRHQRLLELYCRKDRACVCVLCTETDHRAHYTVPVEREWKERKAQLKSTVTDVQQMIQERLKKVEEIRSSAELNKASAHREIEYSAIVFSELMRSVQTVQAELVLAIQEKQRQTERRAHGLIADLEQEIAELRRRNADLEKLERTDHIHFLQSFPALSTPPTVKDWSGTNVPTDMCIGIIRRSVSKLEAVVSEEIDKLVGSEIKKLLKYTEDVTLDPDTANPWLQLSQDRRQLRHLGAWQDLPDCPERFDTVVIALGRESFAAGRHYWEVQVGSKDDWYMGVTRASINRKGRVSVSVAHGYWALAMKKGQGGGYRVSTCPPQALPLAELRRVGVYLDHEEGQVSFYDVGGARPAHLYTFREHFAEPLLPFFYLYCCDKASDTMAICPGNGSALPVKQS